MSEPVKLKPCPFCGGDAKLWSPPKLKDRRGHYPSTVYCGNSACQAQGPSVTSLVVPASGVFSSLDIRLKPREQQDAEVVAAWNKRDLLQ